MKAGMIAILFAWILSSSTSARVGSVSGWLSHTFVIDGRDYTGLESYASLVGDLAKAERVMVVCPRAQQLQLKLSVGSEVGDHVGLFTVKVCDDRFFIASWHVIFVEELDGRVETFVGSISTDGVLSDEISSFVRSALERIARDRAVEKSKAGEPGATDTPGNAQ